MAPCFRPLVAAQLVLPAPAQDPCLALEDVANSTLSPPTSTTCVAILRFLPGHPYQVAAARHLPVLDLHRQAVEQAPNCRLVTVRL